MNRPIKARPVLTLADLEEIRRRNEEKQRGRAPWNVAPDNAPDEDGPVISINLNSLTTGTTSR